MSDNFELFDRHRETPVRWQSSKETDSDDHNIPSPWKNGDQFGQFTLEKLLGAGSSGWVFRAYDAERDRHCVLKVLKPRNKEMLLRNRIGFRRMLTIEHPNLVKADRIYQIDDYTALSMNEVRGTTLAEAIRRIANMEPEQAFATLLTLIRDYATGLAVLHAHGLVHRDIKPHNLMVDENNRGVIIDYSLVDYYELNDQASHASGLFIATLRYTAPEAICQQRYLPAGDIYSLGLVVADALYIVAKATSHFPTSLRGEEAFTPRFGDMEVDTDLIIENLGGLKQIVPDLIRDACVEMLDRHPSERPTAMRLARLGLPPTSVVPWVVEDPMFGRQEELKKVSDWADSVFEGKVSRLHITGPSGIGKSRLLTEVVNLIESRRWGQVFTAKCRAREDAPLQAFAQICDMIGHRYRREDREKMRLHACSANFLCQSFPVLGAVIQRVDEFDPTPVQELTRDDALEAGAQLSEELRNMGPLFIVIDDAQWADRDSLNVLDRLQVAVGQHGLGLITVSREPKDPQRRSANVTIALEKLSLKTAVEMLQHAAQRHGLDVPLDQIERYAVTADGSAFRLQELVEEFSPSGMLHWLHRPLGEDDELGELAVQPDPYGSIDQFWRRRVDMLSSDAKALLPLIAAGGHSSTRQLTELSGLGDAVDAAISELTKARLIIDDATGRECISILHDRVADELVGSFSEQVQHAAHAKWAELLIKEENPELAARIAGHLFAANRPAQAVHFAILAAEDAERLLALTEAARWFSIAAKYTEGKERVDLVRRTARNYLDADRPAAAAQYYRELSKLVDGDERDECERLSVILSIRCGRFLSVRDQLDKLTKRLQLPRPKSSLMSVVSIAIRYAKLAWKRRKRKINGVEVRDVVEAFGIGKESADGVGSSSEYVLQRKRLDMCNQLARPMSLFDSLYAAELNVVAASLVTDYGTDEQRIHVAVGEAVFGCYNPGKARNDGEAIILALNQYVSANGQLKSRADVWAAIACAHTLASRWSQVNAPLRLAVDAYQSLRDRNGFELAHTQWMDLWADWNLGRWSQMRDPSEQMISDATKRSDLYMQLLTVGGFGVGSYLIDDRLDELQRVFEANQKTEFDSRNTVLFQVFDWMAQVQLQWYEGNYREAWNIYRTMEPALHRYPFGSMQMMRIVRASFGSLGALHCFNDAHAAAWTRQVQMRIVQLRREKNPFSDAIADLHEGLLHEKLVGVSGKANDRGRAIELFNSAITLAKPQRLRPIELAAIDAISRLSAELNGDLSGDLIGDFIEDLSGTDPQAVSTGQLVNRMVKQGIARPEKLARLYTIDPKAIS
ncbi:protein kinase [Rubripirellula amarantea]|nr:protein kinase [Rubripirellula amarantea]